LRSGNGIAAEIQHDINISLGVIAKESSLIA
jgi:hypothetical protein